MHGELDMRFMLDTLQILLKDIAFLRKLPTPTHGDGILKENDRLLKENDRLRTLLHLDLPPLWTCEDADPGLKIVAMKSRTNKTEVFI